MFGWDGARGMEQNSGCDSDQRTILPNRFPLCGVHRASAGRGQTASTKPEEIAEALYRIKHAIPSMKQSSNLGLKESRNLLSLNRTADGRRSHGVLQASDGHLVRLGSGGERFWRHCPEHWF